MASKFKFTTNGPTLTTTSSPSPSWSPSVVFEADSCSSFISLRRILTSVSSRASSVVLGSDVPGPKLREKLPPVVCVVSQEVKSVLINRPAINVANNFRSDLYVIFSPFW